MKRLLGIAVLVVVSALWATSAPQAAGTITHIWICDFGNFTLQFNLTNDAPDGGLMYMNSVQVGQLSVKGINKKKVRAWEPENSTDIYFLLTKKNPRNENKTNVVIVNTIVGRAKTKIGNCQYSMS